jgi:hypothetical protein
MVALRDVTGQLFGRLTPLEIVDHSPVRWRCSCSCGNEKIVIADSLLKGATRSCGCYRVDKVTKRNTTHGGTNEPLFRVWMQMKRRCYATKHPSYPNCGGRGVKVCKGWKQDYPAFRSWCLANGYVSGAGLAVLRIDPLGNYEPSNCFIGHRNHNSASRRAVRSGNGDLYPSAAFASRATGAGMSRIYDVINGHRNTTGGLSWRFATDKEQQIAELFART